jgi:hypothetical protein
MDIPIPTGTEVLERERLSRRQGSQLTTAALVGRWRLHQLWSRTQAQPNPTAAALLRSLKASLSIGAGAAADDDALTVRNSVQLGALQLCFSGHGQLRGARPLLEFWFTEFELRLGRQTLWRQAITRLPEPRRRPFFALIARTGNADSGWLLARGRGGGLALWVLEP